MTVLPRNNSLRSLHTFICVSTLLCICMYTQISSAGGITETLLNKAQAQFRGDEVYYPLPEEAEAAVTHIMEFVEGTHTTLNFSVITPLVSHIVTYSQSNMAWRLKDRWDAHGAAIFSHSDQPMGPRMRVNFSTRIPDYALFYKTLRYSNALEKDKYRRAIEECVKTSAPSQSYHTASYKSIELTTPNIQSGACYVYTNRRQMIRANILGTNVLFSLARMIDNSSLSTRGILIGPEDKGLYYYSDVNGINIRGLTWVQSRMYVSKSLVIYIDLPNGTTAVGMLSWVNAGWNDVNVTQYYHIYTVLRDAIDTLNNIAWNKNIHPDYTGDAIETIQRLPEKKLEELYKKYCAYVEKCYNEQKPSKGLFGKMKVWEEAPQLVTLYSKKTLADMPESYKKALLVQEYIRSLVGERTWSKKGNFDFVKPIVHQSVKK